MTKVRVLLAVLLLVAASASTGSAYAAGLRDAQPAAGVGAQRGCVDVGFDPSGDADLCVGGGEWASALFVDLSGECGFDGGSDAGGA